MAAADPKPAASILEHCRVYPAPPSTEKSLPLTFFDIPWLQFHPTQRLLFYRFPCSKPDFIENIVPSLKKSLSRTLQHFLPLSANVIYPLNSDIIPEIRYIPGDSVSVTIAEANEAHDFNHLTGNHPRDADEFYAFLSDLPPQENEPGFKVIPLFALQVTLFPGAGICIGFVNKHAVGDASSIVGFIKAWCLTSRLGKDGDDVDDILSSNHLRPDYDRSAVKDPKGLLNIYWDQVKRNSEIESMPVNLPTNKIRSTFVLQKIDIQKLRDLVQSKNPNLTHLSSFTITTAFVWSCLAKSSGEEIAGDEPEYFAFGVDARSRMEPPVSASYFGNCVGQAVAECRHEDLCGGDGFAIAAELIGEVISKKVNNKDEFFRDAEIWLSKFEKIRRQPFGVMGSPRFDLYEADFGWGNAEKYESVSLDRDWSMSLCKSREFEGGLEIGLSLSKEMMDTFQSYWIGNIKA